MARSDYSLFHNQSGISIDWHLMATILDKMRSGTIFVNGVHTMLDWVSYNSAGAEMASYPNQAPAPHFGDINGEAICASKLFLLVRL